jgi:membrane-associated phospholipid phosphatase
MAAGSGARLRWVAALAGLIAALAVLTVVELVAPPQGVDTAVLDMITAHRTPQWTAIATAVTNSGASPFTYPLVALAGVLAGVRTRRWQPGVAALCIVVLGVLSRLLLSVLVGDARPPLQQRLVAVYGFSFPSGHAATSALLAGALIWLAASARLPPLVRRTTAAVLVLWAVLVALSRLYLGVHWISDIVGSWLLAGAWLCTLPLLDSTLKLHRTDAAVSPDPVGDPSGSASRPTDRGLST